MVGNGGTGRIAREGGDPVWYWLLRDGPHGSSFQWASELNGRYNALEHLRRIIAEMTEADAEFPNEAREAARRAIQHDHAIVIRRGIQVLAVVGTDEDLDAVDALRQHPIKQVAADARSCLFARGRKHSLNRKAPE